MSTEIDTDDKGSRRAQTLRFLANAAKLGMETGNLQVAVVAAKTLLDQLPADAVDMQPEELAKLTKEELRSMRREVARKLLEEDEDDE